MIVRLFQGTRASQQRHLVVESGVLAAGATTSRQTSPGAIPRQSGVRGALLSQKLSESFASELETMAEPPKVSPPAGERAKVPVPPLKGPPALPPLARNLRKA